MNEIVLAYTPSTNLKDWVLRSDGRWFYEQHTRHYCMAHKQLGDSGGFTDCSPRNAGKEPYYNLATEEVTEPPRVYLTHHPKKGEWEQFKTINDVIASPLHAEGL